MTDFYIGLMDRAEDGSWGIFFPDLPGCTSAGKNPIDIFKKSIEALRLWAEDAINDGETLPEARSVAELDAAEDVAEVRKELGNVFSFIQVPLLLDKGRSVRANISIDLGLLEAIDASAKRLNLTRSAYLASAAREKISEG